MAPGPTPTLTMSAPADLRSATPAAVTTLPATTGTAGFSARTACSAQIIFSWCPCAVSTTSTSAPASSSSLALAADVSVDPDGRADPQPARGIDRGGVQGRAQCPGPGHDADAAALGVEHRSQPVSAVVQQRERPLGRRPGGQRKRVGGHHVAQLGEPVHPEAVRLGDDAYGPALRDHDHGAVRPLGQQAQRVARGIGRSQRQGGLCDQVAGLHPGDHVCDDVRRDVLRQDRDAASPRDGLRHPPPGDRGHVGGHDWDGGAAAVGSGQVDVEPRADG